MSAISATVPCLPFPTATDGTDGWIFRRNGNDGFGRDGGRHEGRGRHAADMDFSAIFDGLPTAPTDQPTEGNAVGTSVGICACAVADMAEMRREVEPATDG